MVNEELLSAYRNTKFCVSHPHIVLQIGIPNPSLDALLQKHGKTNWAYITAFNPFSNLLSRQENEIRHQQLITATNQYACYGGEGIGEDPTWEPEKSLLIIGISEEDAKSIGMQLQQNAIVTGKLNEPPSLKILV